MGLLVKKGAHLQITCMLLVTYLHFSRCSGAEWTKSLNSLSRIFFYILDVFGNCYLVFSAAFTSYVYYE